MTDAEEALRKAAADIPPEVCERLDTAKKLSDEDHEIIIQIARQSLAGFQSKAKSESGPEEQTDSNPKPESEEES